MSFQKEMSRTCYLVVGRCGGKVGGVTLRLSVLGRSTQNRPTALDLSSEPTISKIHILYVMDMRRGLGGVM